MNKLDDDAVHRFLTVRTLIFLIILLVLDFAFIDKKWMTAAGLIIGSIIGILKFAFMSNYISAVLMQGEKRLSKRKLFVKYLLVQFATILVLAVSILISIWLFFGVTAGILLLPFVILINIFTEALSLSHNNFQLRRCKNGRFWRKNYRGNVK